MSRVPDKRLSARQRFMQRKIIQALADHANFDCMTYVNLARLFLPYGIDQDTMIQELEKLAEVAKIDLKEENYLP